jgi:uncharacterized protein (TIGR02246 family)
MHISTRGGVAALLVLTGVSAGLIHGLTVHPAVPGGQPKPEEAKPNPDQAAVHKALEAFVAAFNANDATTAAAVFTERAEFIDEDNNRVEGTKAIEDLLAVFFTNNKGAKLQVTPDGVRTVAPGVAIEDGESVVTVPEKKTQSVRRYTMIYAKVGEQWKIASIREYPEEPEVLTPAERLAELEWFIGEWVDEGGDAVVTTTVKMAPDRSHLTRDFVVMQQGQQVLSGTQRIAVDPLTGLIRGWSFDSGGGHGESSWTRNGDAWLIRGTGVTAEGEFSSATYILKPLSKDRIELKVVNKVVGDTVEADTTSILVRKPTRKK